MQTVCGPRTAWILTPTTHLRVGRARLRELEAGEHTGSATDRAILEQVRAIADGSQLVVFRARDDAGAGSWAFEDDLSDAEAHRLGYHLVLDQLPLYRRLVAAGVYALLHVDFGGREVDAYQHGTNRVLAELEAGSIPEVARDDAALALDQMDRWILHNLTFFFMLPLPDVTESVLAKQLPLLEERVPHLRELVASLPPGTIA